MCRSTPERRKDAEARATAFAEADIAVLCLPDAAAVEAVGLAGECRIIDASTAHRVRRAGSTACRNCPDRPNGSRADRVANVGCYATGSIALIRPLRDAGLIGAEDALTLTGTSGYTGGGKALIAEVEAGTAPAHFLYATGQDHKHIPEIMEYGRLSRRAPPSSPPSAITRKA